MVGNPPDNVGNKGSVPDREDPTCLRVIKPECHNYWACVPEPGSLSYQAQELWSLCSATRKVTATGSPHTQRGSSPCSLQLGKSLHSNADPAQPKINKYMFFKRHEKKFQKLSYWNYHPETNIFNAIGAHYSRHPHHVTICVHIGPFSFFFLWKKNENVLYLIIASKKALKYPYYNCSCSSICKQRSTSF